MASKRTKIRGQLPEKMTKIGDLVNSNIFESLNFNEDQRTAMTALFQDLFQRKAVITPFDMRMDEPNPTWSIYENTTNTSADRKKKYKDYDDMDEDTLISSALDIYAAEAVQFNVEKNTAVWVNTDNTEIKECLDQLHQTLDLDDYIELICRNMAKYGEDFVGPLYNKKDGIVNLRFVDPVDVEVKADRYHRTYGYVYRQSDKVLNPWDFVHFKCVGRNHTVKNGTRVYGGSMIEPVRRTWRQLKLIEDALIIYRLDVGAKRLVFYIDTGTMDMKQAMDLVRQWERAYKRRVYYNPQSGELISRHSPLALDSHIFWPVKKDSQSKVEYLGGDANIGGIADLDYFKKKMGAGLKIPMAYLGGDDYSAVKSGLSRMDIQFARMVRRLQRGAIRGILMLDQIHLRLMNIDFSDNDFQVVMTPISSVEEQERIEALNLAVDCAAKLKLLGSDLNIPQEPWRAYILKDILHISDRHLLAVGIDPGMAALKGAQKAMNPVARAKVIDAVGKILNEYPEYAALNNYLIEDEMSYSVVVNNKVLPPARATAQ